MIDIHSHLLFGVDDGPRYIEESLDMLQDAAEQGVTAMILTPHYRGGMFSYPKDLIDKNLAELKAKSKNIGVELYLGTELHMSSNSVEYLKTQRVRTLAGTHYVLAEYKPESDFAFIKNSVQDLIRHGYIPIVAHVERYACLRDIECISFLREIGAMIQVNADAIIGKDGFRAKAYTKKLLAGGLVDFVGSDCHSSNRRRSHMGKCREYLYKKFDKRYVDDIFYNNANEILLAIEK